MEIENPFLIKNIKTQKLVHIDKVRSNNYSKKDIERIKKLQQIIKLFKEFTAEIKSNYLIDVCKLLKKNETKLFNDDKLNFEIERNYIVDIPIMKLSLNNSNNEYNKDNIAFRLFNETLFSNYKNNFQKSKIFIDNKNYYIDIEWIREVNKYIMTLNYSQLCILNDYTGNNYKVINSYLLNDTKNLENHVKNIKTNDYYNPYYLQMIDLLHETNDFSEYFKVHKEIVDKVRVKYVAFIKKNKRHLRNLNENIYSLVYVLNYIKTAKILHKYKFTLLNYMLFAAKDEFIYKCIQIHIDEINNIIKNSPPVKHDIIVYRGMNKKIFDKKYTNVKTFSSCSFNMHASIGFIDNSIKKNNKKIIRCCMHRILIPKGSRILYITPITNYNESEIVLPTNSYFYIVNKNNTMNYFNNDLMRNNYMASFCGNNSYINFKLNVTDLIYGGL